MRRRDPALLEARRWDVPRPRRRIHRRGPGRGAGGGWGGAGPSPEPVSGPVRTVAGRAIRLSSSGPGDSASGVAGDSSRTNLPGATRTQVTLVGSTGAALVLARPRPRPRRP